MQNSNIYFTLRNINSNNKDQPSSIRSVQRAIKILVCLSNGINTLTELTHQTNLTKPTVYRLLKTLEELMVVTRDPVKRQYFLGPLIHQIASNPETNHQYLTTCAFEELRQLWEMSGETVELNTMVGLRYSRIYEIPSKYDLKVINGPDPVGPVYVGAAAKVLLSQLDDNELKAALKSIKISRVTEYSVVDKSLLLKQIQEIRTRGYDVSHSERILGAFCISAPINYYFWPVALTLVGPDIRLKAKQDTIIQEVIASARRISLTLKEFLLAKGVSIREQGNTNTSADRQ